MKVLLVDAGRGNQGAASGGGMQGNLGLEYVAAFVRSKNHRVVVLEPPLNNISYDEIIKMAGEGEYDAVGISCMTWNMDQACLMASQIKSRYPKVRLATGGNGPTGMPGYFSDHFDAVIIGEGEKPFLDWLEGREEKKIVLATRDPEWDGEIFPLRNKEVIKNSQMRGIWPIAYDKQVVANIIYSKGCYGQCSFCSSPLTWLRKVVWREPESVARELIMLHEKFRVNSVDFIDATFNSNNEKVLELCETLERFKINEKIQWTAMISPSHAGIETILPAMRRAGCIKVGVGLEDPSSEIRRSLLKGGNSNHCQQTIELAAMNGLLVRVYIIIGAPMQTSASIEMVGNVLNTWPIDEPRISIFTPFPGTSSWAELQNQIIERDFCRYDTNNPIIQSSFTSEELLKIRLSLTKSFFTGNNYLERRRARITKDASFALAYDQFEKKFLIPKGYIG